MRSPKERSGNKISSEAGQWPLFRGYTIVSSTRFRDGVLEAWPWPRGASRTTGHVLGFGLGGQVLGLGGQVLGLGLGKHVLGLDHFHFMCLGLEGCGLDSKSEV